MKKKFNKKFKKWFNFILVIMGFSSLVLTPSIALVSCSNNSGSGSDKKPGDGVPPTGPNGSENPNDKPAKPAQQVNITKNPKYINDTKQLIIDADFMADPKYNTQINPNESEYLDDYQSYKDASLFNIPYITTQWHSKLSMGYQMRQDEMMDEINTSLTNGKPYVDYYMYANRSNFFRLPEFPNNGYNNGRYNANRMENVLGSVDTPEKNPEKFINLELFKNLDKGFKGFIELKNGKSFWYHLNIINVINLPYETPYYDYISEYGRIERANRFVGNAAYSGYHYMSKEYKKFLDDEEKHQRKKDIVSGLCTLNNDLYLHPYSNAQFGIPLTGQLPSFRFRIQNFEDGVTNASDPSAYEYEYPLTVFDLYNILLHPIFHKFWINDVNTPKTYAHQLNAIYNAFNIPNEIRDKVHIKLTPVSRSDANGDTTGVNKYYGDHIKVDISVSVLDKYKNQISLTGDLSYSYNFPLFVRYEKFGGYKNGNGQIAKEYTVKWILPPMHDSWLGYIRDCSWYSAMKNNQITSNNEEIKLLPSFPPINKTTDQIVDYTTQLYKRWFIRAYKLIESYYGTYDSHVNLNIKNIVNFGPGVVYPKPFHYGIGDRGYFLSGRLDENLDMPYQTFDTNAHKFTLNIFSDNDNNFTFENVDKDISYFENVEKFWKYYLYSDINHPFDYNENQKLYLIQWFPQLKNEANLFWKGEKDPTTNTYTYKKCGIEDEWIYMNLYYSNVYQLPYPAYTIVDLLFSNHGKDYQNVHHDPQNEHQIGIKFVSKERTGQIWPLRTVLDPIIGQYGNFIVGIEFSNFYDQYIANSGANISKSNFLDFVDLAIN